MAYITVDEAKAYIGQFANDDDDDLLTELITAAQGVIENQTHRVFEAAANTTRYYDAECDVFDRTLWLPRGHELASINTVTNGDGVVINASYYVTEPRNTTPIYGITLKRNSPVYWTWNDTSENAIAVSGKFAYSATPPADIALACKRLVKWMYKQRDHEAADDVPQMSPSGMVMLPGKLPKDVAELLAPYVLRA